jgi:hypothetical protein
LDYLSPLLNVKQNGDSRERFAAYFVTKQTIRIIGQNEPFSPVALARSRLNSYVNFAYPQGET